MLFSDTAPAASCLAAASQPKVEVQRIRINGPLKERSHGAKAIPSSFASTNMSRLVR